MPIRSNPQYLLALSGAGCLAMGVAGILGMYSGLTFLASFGPGYKLISLYATLVWCFFGAVLIWRSVRSPSGMVRAFLAALLAAVAIVSAINLPQSLLGYSTPVETMINSVAAPFMAVPLASVSPNGELLRICAAVGLFQLVVTGEMTRGTKKERAFISLTGLLCATLGTVFVLSYLYEMPSFMGLPVVPLAFTSALAALFVGAGLVAAAGETAFPLIYFAGASTRARLLRFFVPLTILIVIAQSLLIPAIIPFFRINIAVELAVSIVIFCFITVWIVSLVAGGVGEQIDHEKEQREVAEEELQKKHTDLHAAYEQLTATEEELRQNYEELEQSQKELSKSEQKFRILADFTYDWEYWIDQNGAMVYTSPSCERITGYPPGDFMAFAGLITRIVHPDDLPLFLEHTNYVCHPPQAGELEFRILHRDGTVRWLGHTCRPIPGTHGEFLGTRVSNRDITSRKETEVALRESRAEFAAALESMTDAVFISDTEGRFVAFNDAFATFHRFKDKSECKRTLAEYPGLLDVYTTEGTLVPLDMWVVSRALRGETGTNAQYTLRRKDTGESWVGSYSFAPVRDEQGRITGSVVSARDITSQNRAEQEIRQKNAELERFTYTVSHDLKSPLITIRGFAGLLEEDIRKNDTEKIVRDLDRILAATQKMETLLKDLLNLSRIGRLVNAPETVSFTVIAQEAVELLDAAVRCRGITVVIDPDMPAVSVDRVRIREAVINLVENAIKFMEGQPHPAIRIGVQYDGNQPVFFVRDNGIGIETEYHERIFNLFEKLDAKREGSGAGLAIVKRIIEVHGGRIWVESGGPGTGCTFFFTLPVQGHGETGIHNTGKNGV